MYISKKNYENITVQYTSTIEISIAIIYLNTLFVKTITVYAIKHWYNVRLYKIEPFVVKRDLA